MTRTPRRARATATAIVATVALVALVALVGCSGGSATPDASPDAPASACGAAVATISSFPGEYAGVTLGAGADLAVAEGACADERLYFGDAGEDEVIEVTGMTPGTYYVISLETADDLAFYVATACNDDGPSIACLLHVDQTTGDEAAEVLAPSNGRFLVVVDASNDPIAPATGAYTLRIAEAACVPGELACTDPIRTICSDYTCVECAGALDCAGPTPACDATGTCVASLDACTGDDAGEPDDGPGDATVIAPPTAGNPTVIAAAICSAPATEGDWYGLTVASDRSVRVDLSWADGTADLDVTVYDSAGAIVGAGNTDGAGPEAMLLDLVAGTYSVEVAMSAPAGTAAATPYTLTVSVPECTDDLGCANPASPVCAVGVCTAGPALCTGDDAGDAGGGDDGPNVARNLTGAVGTPVSLAAAACNTPSTEADWYRATVAAGQGLSLDVAFAAGLDFDIAVFDGQLRLVGLSFWERPEHVVLSYLPAGTYYIRIVRYADPAVTAAAAYTITSTRTAAQACVTRAECAADYSTQLYRGACAADGSCGFIAAGARALGAACDTGDDCDSGSCSYTRFEADAQRSICTQPCVLTADCDAVGVGLTCTTGFATDVCVPACATALDCGANPASGALDAGEPWDYFVCTPATGVCSPT